MVYLFKTHNKHCKRKQSCYYSNTSVLFSVYEDVLLRLICQGNLNFVREMSGNFALPIQYEPWKPTKWSVRPAKSSSQSDQSSLSAWRSIGTLATHWVHSEDWSVWADAQAESSLGAQSFCHAASHLCSVHTAKMQISLCVSFIMLNCFPCDGIFSAHLITI